MSKAPTEAIMKMIDVGGRGLLMEKDENRYTTLHCYAIDTLHCYAIDKKASTEVIIKMIEVGGRDKLLV